MKSLIVGVILRAVILFGLLFLNGCHWESSTKPSVLIIAVENLNADAFICGDTSVQFEEGLGRLCDDGVRFTHAYTPSVMSQSALTSILTGLYPQESGVWHNGQQYLSEKFQTVAEVAFGKGYRTFFVSGGAPIWRKSGLAQGFEVFDDNFNVNKNDIYRPVSKNFDIFLNWINENNDGSPFFSVIYLSDLQFLEKSTINESGQERAVGFDSQLSEINESFAALIQKMKSQKIWDNTYVIFTGLNGRTPLTRRGEFNSINMHSENTQVLMMIKPAKKIRDAGINWTIDVNVSLADVGATLYDILGSPEELVSYNRELDVSSLRSALNKPQVDWGRDRYILTSSAWPSWRGVGGIRAAVRKNNMLLINDQTPKFINALTDRFETQPLSNKEVSSRSTIAELSEFIKRQGISTWDGITVTLIEKLVIFADLMRESGGSDQMKMRLSHLVQQRPWDKQVLGWLARVAVEGKDWELLDMLGEKNIYPLWSYIARRNSGLDIAPPNDACWEWLSKKQKVSRSSTTCSDEELILFGEWTRESDANKKTALEDKFIRAHLLSETDEYIARTNFLNGLSWDTALDVPAEPRYIQLALTLSEYKGFKQIIDKRLKRF